MPGVILPGDNVMFLMPCRGGQYLYQTTKKESDNLLGSVNQRLLLQVCTSVLSLVHRIQSLKGSFQARLLEVSQKRCNLHWSCDFHVTAQGAVGWISYPRTPMQGVHFSLQSSLADIKSLYFFSNLLFKLFQHFYPASKKDHWLTICHKLGALNSLR